MLINNKRSFRIVYDKHLWLCYTYEEGGTCPHVYSVIKIWGHVPPVPLSLGANAFTPL